MASKYGGEGRKYTASKSASKYPGFPNLGGGSMNGHIDLGGGVPAGMAGSTAGGNEMPNSAHVTGTKAPNPDDFTDKNILTAYATGNPWSIPSINRLSGIDKHLAEYDADPNTPGLQLSHNNVDNTAKMLRDPNTLKYLHAVSNLPGYVVENYRRKVNYAASEAYKQYAARETAAGRVPQDEKDWKSARIAKMNPLYAALDPMAQLGEQVKQNSDGTYSAIGGWNTDAATAYETMQKYTTDGKLNTDKLMADILSAEQAGAQADAGLRAAHRTLANPAIQSALNGFGLAKHIPDGTNEMLAGYAGLGRDNLRALGYIQNNQGNEDAMFTDAGRKNLGIVAGLVNNKEAMENIRRLNPKAHDQLAESAGKLNFINSNYDSVNSLRQFKNNPLAFIFRNLFSGDASSLYSAIDSMGRIFNPSQADLNWSKYLGGGETAEYASYLPWLQLLGNIRSVLGGEGIRYQSV